VLISGNRYNVGADQNGFDMLTMWPWRLTSWPKTWVVLALLVVDLSCGVCSKLRVQRCM